MANQKNIEKHKFKPGQSGNPAGRKKGSQNSKTILKKWLTMTMKAKNPISKLEEEMPVMEAATVAIIGQALQGNVYAYNSIMDRLEGKPNQRIEQVGEGGGPIQVDTVVSAVDYTKLSDAALLEIVQAGKKDNHELPATTKTKDGVKSKGSGNKKK